MVAVLRKIWLDTTTYQGHYVAKDVHKAVSFLIGILLVGSSFISGFWGKSIPLDAGALLLAYSLGSQTVKGYFQYKNNAVASDCSNDSAPSGDDEPPAGGPPQPIKEE